MAARARYFNQAYQVDGVTVAIVPNAEVTLYEAGTSTPIDPAEIFAGASGGTTRPNPFDADAYGNIEFFLADARRVKIEASGVGVGPLTVDYEPVLWDPVDQIVYTYGDQIVAKGSDLGTALRVTGTGSKITQTNATSTVSLQASDAADAVVPLYLQPTVGAGYATYHSTWTEAVYFINENQKRFRASAAQGSAVASDILLVRDDHASGSDSVTRKIIHHVGGDSAAATATSRILELEGIAYLPTSGTSSFAEYGAGDSSNFRNLAGIDIGLAHDPAIVGSPVYAQSLAGLNIFNRGAGTADSKAFTGGNQGTTPFLAWGEAGWKYGWIIAGPLGGTPPLLDDVTGRVSHLKTAGGNDGFLYQTTNTTGTGIRLAASPGGGRNMDIFSVGSAVGAPHTGKLALYDAGSATYLLSAGMNAGDTTKGQVTVIGGTTAFPGLVGYADLDTGIVWDGSDVLAASVGGARKTTWNANGFGVGGAPPSNVALYVSSSGNVGLRIDGAGNFAGATAGAAATLPTIGSGPAAAAATGWFYCNLNGTAVTWPYWLR